MREFVRVGTPAQIRPFRADWIERAKTFAETLALPYAVDLASDPFFGRGGLMLAASQIEQSLKFELLVPILSHEKPTACMSFNDHQDHFGEAWDLKDQDGRPCHTGCVAFGVDRLALALFARHGVDLAGWPASARSALGL
jgi:seryl-tRNA synthetase